MKRAIFLASTLLFPTVTFSDTIIVPDDQPTIQAAINSAVNGDTILVRPGTYVENIDFRGKAVTVKSDQGPDETVIDGNKIWSVVTFESGENMVLDGFTIINGKGNPVTGYEQGGGIYCKSASPIIMNNIIMNNLVNSSGGGIYCEFSSPTITNNNISFNSAGFRGAGIYCAWSSPAVTNNIITGNHAGTDSGGIYCGWSSPIIANNTISQNSANARGGGIGCSYYSDPIVTNTVLWDNSAPTGPEILIAQSTWPSTLTIHFSDVKGGLNSADVESGCTLIWGAGMINADPLFVESVHNDFHLSYPSPCRDTGHNAFVTMSTDFEGDPRIVSGTVDMGADEFYPHLYYTGDATPEGMVKAVFVGWPGSVPVWLWFGSSALEPPMSTKFGYWYLDPPLIGPIDLDSIPSPSGVLILPAVIHRQPPPPYDLFMQALIGLNPDSLTNLCVLKVR